LQTIRERPAANNSAPFEREMVNPSSFFVHESVLVTVIEFLSDRSKASLCVACPLVARNDQVWSLLYSMRTAGTRESVKARSRLRSGTNPRRAYFNVVKMHILMLMKFRELFLKRGKEWSIKSLRKVAASAEFQLREDTLMQRHKSFLGESIFSLAITAGKWKTVKMLVTNFNLNLNDRMSGGLSVLGVAAWAGQHRLIAFFIKTARERDLDIDHGLCGIPPRTSSCKGRKPYSALEWALRKTMCHLMHFRDQHNSESYAYSKTFATTAKVLLSSGAEPVDTISLLGDIKADWKLPCSAIDEVLSFAPSVLGGLARVLPARCHCPQCGAR